MSRRSSLLLATLMFASGAALYASPAATQVTRVSVATDGTQANADTIRGVISGNGLFVTFVSTASNLVAGDTNAASDVFVRDLTAQTTTRVSVASDGTERTGDSGWPFAYSTDRPAISNDGTIVAFTSAAAFAPDDTNQCQSGNAMAPCQDIYVRDRTAGTTTRVSVASDGTQGNNASYSPSLSGDGRYVVFTSGASNLAPGDGNGRSDVFLHDRTTHTTVRVSLDTAAAEFTTGAFGGKISGNGEVIVFISAAPQAAPPLPGPALPASVEAYIRPRSGGPSRVIRSIAGGGVNDVALSADGTMVALYTFDVEGRHEPTMSSTVSLNNQPGNITYMVFETPILGLPGPRFAGFDLSADGRAVAYGSMSATAPTLTDPITVLDPATGLSEVAATAGGFPSLSANGRFLLYASARTDLVANDTNGFADLFVLDRDPDGDGILSVWETAFGLNPNDPADASADPDGDGLTNLQEFQAHSHPTATHTRYFAEGASNDFFQMRVAVLNPGNAAARVGLRLLGSNGQVTSVTRTVAANSRATFDLNTGNNRPDSAFSAIVESDQPVVADRLMAWDAYQYGSSLETSTAAPGTTWYLAEGASGSPYSLYYLLQNPGETDAQATVTYLLKSPQAPITKTYDVAAHSRRTIDVAGEDPALKHAEVSAKIVSTQPIVVERSMYYSTPARFGEAGHAGAAVAAPATRWFVAEGATGFFDEYLLIANAESTASQITITYLLEDDTPFVESFRVDANSRYTVDVKSRSPRLASRAVSAIVESTNAVPVVVERAMWWPHGNWYEATLSAGVTSTGTKWAMAEGEQGGAYGYTLTKSATYVLIANTDPANDGTATVTLVYEDGTNRTTTVSLPANSRRTVDIGAAFGTTQPAVRFGIIVESSGVPIVVERVLYSTQVFDGSPLWSGGASSVATNITPVP